MGTGEGGGGAFVRLMILTFCYERSYERCTSVDERSREITRDHEKKKFTGKENKDSLKIRSWSHSK